MQQLRLYIEILTALTKFRLWNSFLVPASDISIISPCVTYVVLLILVREEERRRESNMEERETLIDCVLHTLYWDGACGPGICPNREWNYHPLGAQDACSTN